MQRRPEHSVETLLARGGRASGRIEGFSGVPVTRTTTVSFRDTEQLAGRQSDLWNSTASEPYAANLGSLASEALEQTISALEAGAGCIVVPTGQAAIVTALSGSLVSGDHLMIPSDCYGITRQYASEYLVRSGITHSLYDPLDAATWTSALTPSTRLLFVEAPASLSYRIADLSALMAFGRAHDLTIVADGSWASPLGWQSIAQGADIAVQSLSKLMSGHADIYLGSVTASTAEKHLALRKFAAFQGYYTDPEVCMLALRGMKTLPLRLERQMQSALEIIDFLSEQPEISEIHYPAWPKHSDYQQWQRYFKAAPGLFKIDFADGIESSAVKTFIDVLQLFDLSVGWGGTSSLTWPGQTPMTLRFAVGLEDPADLVADLAQALVVMRKSMIGQI